MIEVFQLQAKDSIHDNRASDTFEAYWQATFKGDAKAIADIFNGKYAELSYSKVANVESEDLEMAFELTNSIDSYWGENEGVEDLTDGSRSTSVGDFMIKDGGYHAVSSFGFTRFDI